MHCKGFLETWLTFEVPTFLIPLLFSVVLCVCLLVVEGKIRLWEVRGKSITQVSLCYILKHLEDRKAWHVLIYYTWCDIILIFKLHRRTRLTPRSSIHSLKIRMTSHPCNKYEQIMLSYLLSVKYMLHDIKLVSKSSNLWCRIFCYIKTSNVDFWFSLDESLQKIYTSIPFLSVVSEIELFE